MEERNALAQANAARYLGASVRFVDIEGSGQAITTLLGTGNDIGFLTAVVLGASNSELRQLKVQSVGRGFTNSIAVLLNNVTNASVRDATLLSNGASGANWGLRNLASTSSLQNLTISAGGGSQAYGIACTGASGGVSRPAIRRAVISVANAGSNHGIFADQNAAPSVRDAEIQVSGGASSFGLRYSYAFGGLTGGTLEVTNSKVVVSGSTSQALGIEIEGTGNTYNVTHSNVSATGASTSVGIRNQSGDLAQVVSVDHCDVGGTTNSIAVPFAIARVGASRLAGGANIGAPACAATFDASYAPLNGSCL